MSAWDYPFDGKPPRGWPPPAPPHGFARTPHAIFLRLPRITGTPVEADVIRCIFDQTVGYSRDWAELAIGWFAWVIGVSPRAVMMGLEAAIERGLVLKHRAGQLNEYSIDLERLDQAQPYVRPAPRPVAAKPVKMKPAAIIPLRLKRITYQGRLLTPPGGADIFTTEIEASAVAQCKACQTVDIFPLIPCSHLEISEGEEVAKDEPEFTSSEETAKDEPEFRFREEKAKTDKGTTTKGPSRGSGSGARAESDISTEGAGRKKAANRGGLAGAAISKAIPTARTKEIHRLLSQWKDAFLGVPPTMAQAHAIAEALGEAPGSYLQAIMKSRARWIHERADHYGAIRPLATQALEAFEQEQLENAGADEPESSPEPPPAVALPQHPIWDAARQELRERLGDVPYKNWIEKTGAINGRGRKTLEIVAADENSIEWISEEYGEIISEVLGSRGVTRISYRALGGEE